MVRPRPLKKSCAGCTAHTTTIPFENLDIVLGREVWIDLPGMQEKLLCQRRGGYCFEHNLLFAALLERLGFPVIRLAGRVRMHNTKTGIIARSREDCPVREAL